MGQHSGPQRCLRYRRFCCGPSLRLCLLLLLTVEPASASLIRIPLRRVHTGHRTLNPLRGWGKPAATPALGAPSPGDKPTFVPLSNYMNGSTTVSTPRPPAPSNPMGPSLPFSMQLGG
uniref:Napsin A aspartic peptidase n=1 Tax=Panthera tigris altaica TaxID=74533 RepID=A0A8C9K7X0_PANTA